MTAEERGNDEQIDRKSCHKDEYHSWDEELLIWDRKSAQPFWLVNYLPVLFRWTNLFECLFHDLIAVLFVREITGIIFEGILIAG